MKRTLLSLILVSCLFPVASQAQPRYDRAQMNLERLNRGVVAIRSGEKVIVSWRTLSTDAVGEPFDVYRDGQKLNSQPLRQGVKRPWLKKCAKRLKGCLRMVKW